MDELAHVGSCSVGWRNHGRTRCRLSASVRESKDVQRAAADTLQPCDAVASALCEPGMARRLRKTGWTTDAPV